MCRMSTSSKRSQGQMWRNPEQSPGICLANALGRSVVWRFWGLAIVGCSESPVANQIADLLFGVAHLARRLRKKHVFLCILEAC